MRPIPAGQASAPMRTDPDRLDVVTDPEFGVLTVRQIHLRYIQVAASGDYDYSLRGALEAELKLRGLDELAELLSAISAVNRSGGWPHPVDRNRALGRVTELLAGHRTATRLQPVTDETTVDTATDVKAPCKTVSVYRVEFSNTTEDAFHADPFTVTAATEVELTDAIANHFHDEDEPLTENLIAVFDAPGGVPDFDNGSVAGLVGIGNDEAVCAFTATRGATIKVPEHIDLDNDDELMGAQVVLATDQRGGKVTGTVIAAGLDGSTGNPHKIPTAIVVVECDDGEIRMPSRRQARRLHVDTTTR